MAASTKSWVDDSPPRCAADDLNGFKSENNNLIAGSGQIPSDADNQQTHKSVAHYAVGGDYYTDSGAANTYVLSPGGSRTAPPGYFTGMRVRFVPANTNTGASTVNIGGFGAKSLVLPDYPGAALPAGTISGLVEAYYDGTSFVLTRHAAPLAVQPQWIRPAEFIAGASVPSLSSSAVAALSGSRVAYVDNSVTGELRAYDVDGTSFSLVGSGLAISGITNAEPALAALSSSRVAFIDDLNEELRAYDFNGSTWSLVGSGLSIAGISSPALTALSSSRVAYIDDTLDELRVYSFNGSTWSLVGSGLSISSVSSPSITALSETDIAYMDSANDDLRVYRFNGSTWSQVGSDLNVGGTSEPTLAALNSTDVAMIDAGNDELRVYRFDGSVFAQSGSSLSVACSAPALAALNGKEVVMYNVTGGDLTAYEFSFSVGQLPQSRQITG